MMYIDTESSSKNWHVGEPLSIPARLDLDRVVSVQADSDELNYLYDRFPDLPRVKDSKVIRFYGDTAKFIVGNLI